MYFNIYLFIYAPTSYLFKIFYHNNKLLKFCSYLCSFAVCFHQEQMLVVLPSLQGRGEVTAGGGAGAWACSRSSIVCGQHCQSRGEGRAAWVQHSAHLDVLPRMHGDSHPRERFPGSLKNPRYLVSGKLAPEKGHPPSWAGLGVDRLGWAMTRQAP